MFRGSTEPEIEVGFLRSGRRYRSRKRRKIEEGRRAASLFEASEQELSSQEDEGSCEEKEDDSLISKGAEKYEESVGTPRSGRNYITPTLSPEVRYRASYPEIVINTDSASTVTNA